MEEEFPMNTALIGLDYIVDIMHPDGRIARCAEQAALRGVVARFNRALAVAEQRGWLRIAVRVGFEPGYPDLPEHSPIFAAAQALGALDLCGRGCAFHPDLKRDAVQMEVLKPRISAFYATRLEAVLRARRIERLVLAGVSTTWAVPRAMRTIATTKCWCWRRPARRPATRSTGAPSRSWAASRGSSRSTSWQRSRRRVVCAPR